MNEPCKRCDGTGRTHDPCDTCDSNGWIDDLEDGGTMDCPDCGGESAMVCPECEGDGVELPTS